MWLIDRGRLIFREHFLRRSLNLFKLAVCDFSGIIVKMMIWRNFYVVGSILGAFFLFSEIQTTYAAFGVSPPAFRTEHALKGSTYSQIIYLVRDQADEELNIAAKLDINDRIRSWFVINDGKEIIIPKGVRQFPVNVTLKIPKDANLGVYNGTMSFVGAPARAGQVTIALGAEVTINIIVGTGIYRKFSVPLIEFLDIEEGWSPRMNVKVNNEGNIAENLDRAVYELYDQFGAVRLAYIQKNDGFPEIEPFTIRDFIVEFPIDLHLGVGNYWGSVSLMKDEKVIATQRTVFKVLEKGSLSPGIFKLIFLHIQKNQDYYGAGVLALLLGYVFFFRKRKKFWQR